MIIGPRNFFTRKMREGKTDDVFFGRPQYNAIGDPFKMAAINSMRTVSKDGHLKSGHEKMFVPTKKINGMNSKDASSLGIKAPFEYIP